MGSIRSPSKTVHFNLQPDSMVLQNIYVKNLVWLTYILKINKYCPNFSCPKIGVHIQKNFLLYNNVLMYIVFLFITVCPLFILNLALRATYLVFSQYTQLSTYSSATGTKCQGHAGRSLFCGKPPGLHFSKKTFVNTFDK